MFSVDPHFPNKAHLSYVRGILGATWFIHSVLASLAVRGWVPSQARVLPWFLWWVCLTLCSYKRLIIVMPNLAKVCPTCCASVNVKKTVRVEFGIIVTLPCFALLLTLLASLTLSLQDHVKSALKCTSNLVSAIFTESAILAYTSIGFNEYFGHIIW